MEAFKWNEKNSYWYLFNEKLGIYCYLHQAMAPVIPETNHITPEMPYIYTLVQALLTENQTWTLKATSFSNVYEALEYSEGVLGYLPKFRDPNEDVYYSTHVFPKAILTEESVYGEEEK